MLSQLKQEATPLIVRNAWGHPGFTLTIDGKTVQAYENQTLLSVAIDNGILHIPNLCNDEKLEPTSACRMCLVHIQGIDRPLPSCNTPATPGQVVTTDSDELFQIRRTNLELMLSDHNAYCQPPCQVDCPTHIDIPGYLELIAKGSMKEAARLVKEVLPFPYILGLTCPAPCQQACRRALVDEEIAICRMHGHAAETCLLDPPLPYLQDAPTGKKMPSSVLAPPASPVPTIWPYAATPAKFLICNHNPEACCVTAFLNIVCLKICWIAS